MAQSFRQLIGIHPSTASTSDSVLVIIDAQNEYADGKLATYNVSSTRKAIAGLLEGYRGAVGAEGSGNGESKGNIVHVVHKVPEGTPVFTSGTELAEEFVELKPKDGEPVSFVRF